VPRTQKVNAKTLKSQSRKTGPFVGRRGREEAGKKMHFIIEKGKNAPLGARPPVLGKGRASSQNLKRLVE